MHAQERSIYLSSSMEVVQRTKPVLTPAVAKASTNFNAAAVKKLYTSEKHADPSTLAPSNTKTPWKRASGPTHALRPHPTQGKMP